VRIWDLPCHLLCRQHLLGEHRELHALWSILTTGRRSPYQHHPETLRWVGKLAALYARHEEQVCELERRGYQHHSPLDSALAVGLAHQGDYVNSLAEQVARLRVKGCVCKLEEV